MIKRIFHVLLATMVTATHAQVGIAGEPLSPIPLEQQPTIPVQEFSLAIEEELPSGSNVPESALSSVNSVESEEVVVNSVTRTTVTRFSIFNNVPDVSIQGFNTEGRNHLPGYGRIIPDDHDRFSYRYDLGAGRGAGLDVNIGDGSEVMIDLSNNPLYFSIRRQNNTANIDGLEFVTIILTDDQGNQVTDRVPVTDELVNLGYTPVAANGIDLSKITKITFRQLHADLTPDRGTVAQQRRGEIDILIGNMNMPRVNTPQTRFNAEPDYFLETVQIHPRGLNRTGSGIPGFVTHIEGAESSHTLRYDLRHSRNARVEVDITNRGGFPFYNLGDDFYFPLRHEGASDEVREVTLTVWNALGQKETFLLKVTGAEDEIFRLDLGDGGDRFSFEDVTKMTLSFDRDGVSTHRGQFFFDLPMKDFDGEAFDISSLLGLPGDTQLMVEGDIQGTGSIPGFGRLLPDDAGKPFRSFRYDVGGSRGATVRMTMQRPDSGQYRLFTPAYFGMRASVPGTKVVITYVDSNGKELKRLFRLDDEFRNFNLLEEPYNVLFRQFEVDKIIVEVSRSTVNDRRGQIDFYVPPFKAPLQVIDQRLGDDIDIASLIPLLVQIKRLQGTYYFSQNFVVDFDADQDGRIEEDDFDAFVVAAASMPEFDGFDAALLNEYVSAFMELDADRDDLFSASEINDTLTELESKIGISQGQPGYDSGYDTNGDNTITQEDLEFFFTVVELYVSTYFYGIDTSNITRSHAKMPFNVRGLEEGDSIRFFHHPTSGDSLRAGEVHPEDLTGGFAAYFNNVSSVSSHGFHLTVVNSDNAIKQTYDGTFRANPFNPSPISINSHQATFVTRDSAMITFNLENYNPTVHRVRAFIRAMGGVEQEVSVNVVAPFDQPQVVRFNELTSNTWYSITIKKETHSVLDPVVNSLSFKTPERISISDVVEGEITNETATIDFKAIGIAEHMSLTFAYRVKGTSGPMISVPVIRSGFAPWGRRAIVNGLSSGVEYDYLINIADGDLIFDFEFGSFQTLGVPVSVNFEHSSSTAKRISLVEPDLEARQTATLQLRIKGATEWQEREISQGIDSLVSFEINENYEYRVVIEDDQNNVLGIQQGEFFTDLYDHDGDTEVQFNETAALLFQVWQLLGVQSDSPLYEAFYDFDGDGEIEESDLNALLAEARTRMSPAENLLFDAFLAMDVNGTYTLQHSEFIVTVPTVTELIGKSSQDADWHSSAAIYDIDGNEQIDASDVSFFQQVLQRLGFNDAAIRTSAFNVLDADNSGDLSLDEVYGIAARIIPLYEIRSGAAGYVAELDLDQNGLIEKLDLETFLLVAELNLPQLPEGWTLATSNPYHAFRVISVGNGNVELRFMDLRDPDNDYLVGGGSSVRHQPIRFDISLDGKLLVVGYKEFGPAVGTLSEVLFHKVEDLKSGTQDDIFNIRPANVRYITMWDNRVLVAVEQLDHEGVVRNFFYEIPFTDLNLD